MGGVGKGCLALGLIGLLALAWVVYSASNLERPAESEFTDTTVSNYLDYAPEFNENVQVARKGSPAEDFTYPTISGQVIRLSDYIGRKHVILDFWATWCDPCRRELPELQDFYEEHGDQIEIIAITSEGASAKQAIKQMVASMGLRFPVMHDPSREISRIYPTRGIPFLVFIDIDGTLRATFTGYSNRLDELVAEAFGI